MSQPRALEGVAALAPACHHGMPGIDGVVLAVFAAPAGWIILSDSGLDGDQLEDLYATLGEGPRVDAFTTGMPVMAIDLGQANAIWPRFATQAVACGIRAVFAYPIRLGSAPVGVLSVYRATAGTLSAADQDRVRWYARNATILIGAGAYANDTEQVNTPLPEHAREVQQAVGIVMEYGTVDAVTALHRLRVYAHQSRRPMRDVVAEVRADHLSFDPTTPV